MRLMARRRPFYEAIAAISLAGESQFGDMAETYARTGETRYSLSREATAFWWVHAKADKEHGGAAFEIVSRWTRTDEEQQRVIEALRQSLDMIWCWFDGFVRAVGDDALGGDTDGLKTGGTVAVHRHASGCDR